VNWSGKCKGPGGGIDRVHYAPEFTLVKVIYFLFNRKRCRFKNMCKTILNLPLPLQLSFRASFKS
jgi:hypothetical protein